MKHLELIQLPTLMRRTGGHPDIRVGLIDGPVLATHPDLQQSSLRLLGAGARKRESAALLHGTAVAGVLCARRGTLAPAICPNCTILVRPIFSDEPGGDGLPATTLSILATAIVECVQAGARLLNLSVGLVQSTTSGRREFAEALAYANRRGVLLVAAAGNQGMIGSSPLTGDPGALPVVACDLRGRPLSYTNLGASLGRRGTMAPGAALPSLGLTGSPFLLSGTSAATPLVTGTLALLWSLFPQASATELRHAVATPRKRATLVPPLFNAENAYHRLSALVSQRRKQLV